MAMTREAKALRGAPENESHNHCAPPACCGAGLRCACGSLLARRVQGGIELKCRRCKRLLVLLFEEEVASKA